MNGTHERLAALEQHGEAIESRLEALGQAVRHGENLASDTQAVIVDTRQAVQAVREDLAHLSGAVLEVRRVTDEVRALAAEASYRTDQSPLGLLENLLTRVEPYQPIYGLSVAAEDPRRPSHDRARLIEAALGDVNGLRLLDLGSSLGYFPMYFADRGAQAEGWDFKADNVAVARTAAAITRNSATFHERVVDIAGITAIRPGQYDVVLCLSILHHVTAEHGIAYTQDLVAALVERVPVIVVELARKGEDPDLYWDAAQPDDPMDVFATVDAELEITPLGQFSTHLSEQERPLVLVRRSNAVSVGSRSVPYDVMRSEPYRDTPIGTARQSRRYFFSDTMVVKEYTFSPDRPENWRQIMTELNFFTAVLPLEPVHHAPELVAFDIDTHVARLAIRRTAGALLDERAPLDPDGLLRVAMDVLRSLRDLHRIGLNHNDVRSWNIVVDDDAGGWLIDYGLCSATAYTDDASGLIWALAAGATGAREASTDQEPAPSPDVLPEGPLRSLCVAIRDGERDMDALLAIVGPDPRDGLVA